MVLRYLYKNGVDHNFKVPVVSLFGIKRATWRPYKLTLWRLKRRSSSRPFKSIPSSRIQCVTAANSCLVSISAAHLNALSTFAQVAGRSGMLRTKPITNPFAEASSLIKIVTSQCSYSTASTCFSHLHVVL